MFRRIIKSQDSVRSAPTVQQTTNFSSSRSVGSGRLSFRRTTKQQQQTTSTSLVGGRRRGAFPEDNVDSNDVVDDAIVRIQTISFRSLPPRVNNKYRGILKADNSNSNSSNGSHKEVKFKNLHIREYARTVGDNPSCTSGPPVGISWDYLPAVTVSVDSYEAIRPVRRTHFEMVIPKDVRQQLLRKEWNIPSSQIAAAVRANIRAKHQRRNTVQSLSSRSFGRNSSNNSTHRAAFLGESPSISRSGKKVFRSIMGRKSTEKQLEDLQKQVDLFQSYHSYSMSDEGSSSEYVKQDSKMDDSLIAAYQEHRSSASSTSPSSNGGSHSRVVDRNRSSSSNTSARPTTQKSPKSAHDEIEKTSSITSSTRDTKESGPSVTSSLPSPRKGLVANHHPAAPPPPPLSKSDSGRGSSRSILSGGATAYRRSGNGSGRQERTADKYKGAISTWSSSSTTHDTNSRRGDLRTSGSLRSVTSNKSQNHSGRLERTASVTSLASSVSLSSPNNSSRRGKRTIKIEDFDDDDVVVVKKEDSSHDIDTILEYHV